ncbi:MAG: secondary thiamine-phosphate synthase enzyme YjbQ [Bacillota bacterium]
MRITKTITVKTKQNKEMINITEKINDIITKNAINDGEVMLFVPHTTAGVTINENADPDVKTDMLHGLNTIVKNLQEFKHAEGNSDAHIKSSLIGNTQTLLVHNGELLLGTWQGIYFMEFDGPRTRKINLRIIAS